MDHYIDVLLKPDSEMRESVLANIVYSKLHKALVELNSNFIGVSFPEAQLKPGKRIRLHGSKEHLKLIDNLDWLGRLIGYCEKTEIKPVPGTVQYRTVSRKQSNMTNAKLRRLQRRGSIPEEDIKLYRARMFDQGLHNPYFDLISDSTGLSYRRFIQFGELQDEQTLGVFDSFGLSRSASIPWF